MLHWEPGSYEQYWRSTSLRSSWAVCVCFSPNHLPQQTARKRGQAQTNGYIDQNSVAFEHSGEVGSGGVDTLALGPFPWPVCGSCRHEAQCIGLLLTLALFIPLEQAEVVAAPPLPCRPILILHSSGSTSTALCQLSQRVHHWPLFYAW